jgi:hypothetical protein
MYLTQIIKLVSTALRVLGSTIICCFFVQECLKAIIRRLNHQDPHVNQKVIVL